MTPKPDLNRIQELNVELLETTVTVAQELAQYAEKNSVPFPQRYALGHLLKRASSILNELNMSDKSRRPRDKLTPYPPGGYPLAFWSALASA